MQSSVLSRSIFMVSRVKAALHSVFDDPSIDEITADDLLGEYPAVTYGPPTGTFYVDILTRLGELYAFESLSTERIDFDGVMVSVVTPEMLYRMKKEASFRAFHERRSAKAKAPPG